MSLGFLLATTPDYLQMTEAMVNALQHFHPEATIKIYVLNKVNPDVVQFSADHPDVEIQKYTPPPLSSSDWHPLVWAKFEIFRLPNVSIAIFLDVDQLMYNPLTEHIRKFKVSGKYFGSSIDDDTFAYQFLDVEKIGAKSIPQKALNTGVIITSPDQKVYEAVLDLARENHRNARLPTQAILNLFAAREPNAWEDLGENLMLHPYSPRVLEEPKIYSLIHFWTPRPPFFGANPARKGEITYSQAIKKFQQTYNTEYPEKIFEKDFTNRLYNKWPTKE